MQRLEFDDDRIRRDAFDREQVVAAEQKVAEFQRQRRRMDA